MIRALITKLASVLMSLIFAVSVVSVTFDRFDYIGHADAKGKSGSAKRHTQKGHHGGGGSHHKPNHNNGHGNNHHHHNNDHWHDSHHHHNHHDHYGRWVAGGVAAGVTAAAIGSIVYSLPSGCRTFYSGGTKYWDCGNVYYRASFQGSNVTYVVVERP